jgi:superfamily II DNA or RNA helicase
VTVIAVEELPSGLNLVVRGTSGLYRDAFVERETLPAVKLAAGDGGGKSAHAIAAVWALWMQREIPRIRSSVMATRPLRPFAHQDEAVFNAMLPEARLRFLLADEPGTGKTIMAGMYMAEARRRNLLPGRTILIVPAHIVSKWTRDLERFFGIQAIQITAEIGRDPLDLRSDVDVWITSVDLYTYNEDVRRKVAGARASWSLAIFDEAHRLTPTSQYLGAARQLADRTHHLLMLTATPHRGKEHFFRALLNLLDPVLYEWSERAPRSDEQPLRPAPANFIRRMKEELRDLEGRPLFPGRSAITESIDLTPAEDEAYRAVMDYVDEWYPSDALLARSIYGKRAASSLVAVRVTLGRRLAVLKGAQAGRVPPVAPNGFERSDLAGADVDSDEAWEAAERSVIEARTKDRVRERAAVEAVIELVESSIADQRQPSKWTRTEDLLRQHGIGPGEGQALVFTEFTDTALWLAEVFSSHGYSTRILYGDVPPEQRDDLQQEFLTGKYQVLVSTDAGGEGIDLQSAHVMIDWDIPWSLVRLEQRAGRLHRIGQTHDVFVYHLVAPATREGRVQEVMLNNLAAAAAALGGRIFDLMDAAAYRADFDYSAVLAASQRAPEAADGLVGLVPSAETLARRAREVIDDEDRLASPVDAAAAFDRFASDRVQSINPVIVSEFVGQAAGIFGWEFSETGPAPGIRALRSAQSLPASLGGGRERLVAADGQDLSRAKRELFGRSHEVLVLGPTEEPFRDLVDQTMVATEADLVRGARAVDTASVTPYHLFAYTAEIETHDGFRRNRERVPLLIRFSGESAFEIQWPSVMNLRPSTEAPAPPTPAARLEATSAAHTATDRLRTDAGARQKAIADRGRQQVAESERRHRGWVRSLDPERRQAAVDRLAGDLAVRRQQLAEMEHVSTTPPRLLGWLSVAPGARLETLGYDPDSERVAVSVVLAELDNLGWDVDDRQTAGVGYDLLARHRRTREQRLIEVKGQLEELGPVTLEQHEWAQAQQRGTEYWLYVVTQCATHPRVDLRLQDPAGVLAGPRAIQRFTIPVSQLRPFLETP